MPNFRWLDFMSYTKCKSFHFRHENLTNFEYYWIWQFSTQFWHYCVYLGISGFQIIAYVYWLWFNKSIFPFPFRDSMSFAFKPKRGGSHRGGGNFRGHGGPRGKDFCTFSIVSVTVRSDVIHLQPNLYIETCQVLLMFPDKYPQGV